MIYNIFSPFGSFVPYIGMVTIIMNDYPKFKVSKLEYLWRKECFFFVFPLVVSLLFHDSSGYFIVSNNATHWNPVYCATKIGNINSVFVD